MAGTLTPVSQITALVDAAPRGNLALTMTATDVTLTDEQFDNNSFDITGTLTANVNLIIPDGIAQAFIVRNNTTGAFTLTVKHEATAGVAVHQSATNGYLLYTTGTQVEVVSQTAIATAADITNVPAGNLAATDVQAALNELDIALGGGAQKGEVLAWNTLVQSIPHATWTTMNFNAEGVDDTNSHANGLITIPAGVTSIRGSANVYFSSNNTGDRLVRVIKNGTVVAGGGYLRHPATVFGDGLNVAFDINVVAGDVVNVSVHQTSGAALNMGGIGAYNAIHARMY